nr:hypothetical protein [candidate division Zixibacteria bacterium]
MRRKISAGDTLTVFYTPLPTWLKRHYGLQPELISGGDVRAISPDIQPISPAGSLTKSSLSITGAKRFSILSQTGGSSQFDQSLDLTVGGELTPGVIVSGSVSDRGYDPVYGTINSRISELDKINLRVESRKFFSEIGNLEIAAASDFGLQKKQVSGLQAVYHDSRFSAATLFARPRGEYKTMRFYGTDGNQGPYRIVADNLTRAIVPGSERVWADGRLLERGSDRDYIMDYPAASITFMSDIPVDSRTRVEIDFEPLAADYQREMYQLSGGIASSDSVFQLRAGFIREGDDRNRLKTSELAEIDIALLETIGDSTELSFKSGAVPDTAGDYRQSVDSLGNPYYEYAGEGAGDYRISFTSAATGRGDYLYNGNGVYHYIGPGEGDYLPLIRVPVPSREDFYETELELRPEAGSSINLVMRQSSTDQNLYSSRDDGNNLGGQYLASFNVGGIPVSGRNATAISGSMGFVSRYFKPRNRRTRPDFERWYLIPDNLIVTNDEIEMTLSLSAVMPGPYSLLVESERLEYRHQFESTGGSLTVFPKIHGRLYPTATYRHLETAYRIDNNRLKGRNDRLTGGMEYDLNEKTRFSSGLKYDRRWNYYTSFLQGTTERQYDFGMQYGSIGLDLQRYEEDTLLTDWNRLRDRNRVILSLSGQLGAVRADLYLVGQRLTQNDFRENQLLSRLNLFYSNPRKKMSVGGTYALSDENRYERGLRYLEVEPGMGKYILEDGQYIPDPEGNYIEIEEIHSTLASVNKGDKSFSLSYTPRNIYFKIQSNSNEDLLADGHRSWLWLLPFYSDGGEPYFYRRLYHQGDLRLFNAGTYYILNLSASYSYEGRRIGGIDYVKDDQSYRIAVNQSTGDWQFIQEGTYFAYYRDSYYSSPGDIDGFRIEVGAIKGVPMGHLSSFVAYRYAGDDRKSSSKIYSLIVNPDFRTVKAGETSIRVEMYYQDLKAVEDISYRLTDNMNGRRGVIWSVHSDYRFTRDLKMTLTFSGRHSDNRKPRITGRGEIVASF